MGARGLGKGLDALFSDMSIEAGKMYPNCNN